MHINYLFMPFPIITYHLTNMQVQLENYFQHDLYEQELETFHRRLLLSS